MIERRTVWRVLALLVGTTLALVAVEAGLRLFDIEPTRMQTKRRLSSLDDPRLHYHCYASNPHGELRAAPAVDTGRWRLLKETVPMEEISLDRLPETPWCVEYRLSGQDLRDREYGRQPAQGVVRIVGIGDSFAFGEGVPLEQGLFRQLESELGPGYEIVNAARPGADTRRELELLAQVCPGLSCSRALVVFVPNDIGMTEELFARQDFINDLIVIREEGLVDRGPRLLRFAGATLEMRRITDQTIEWYRDLYDPAHNPAALDELQRNLVAIASVTDCPAILVLYPLMEGLGAGYPFTEIHATVTRMAGEAGLPVIDLAPAFDGEKAEALHVHPVDHHPNGAAHRLAARAIVSALRTHHREFLAR